MIRPNDCLIQKRENARFFAFLATFFATRVARIVASFRIFREQSEHQFQSGEAGGGHIPRAAGHHPQGEGLKEIDGPERPDGEVERPAADVGRLDGGQAAERDKGGLRGEA